MIQVTPFIAIDERELQEDFLRSSGAGGQNIQKVETAVQLRFDVANSPNLPPLVRDRLMRLSGRRADQVGRAHHFGAASQDSGAQSGGRA